ncbi:molecular chaperone DnaJ [filamentous cyanobacterium CCP5]|nr:molecular chaperone DnaJ [filamentous cyanobacterium CCP5]
MKIDQGLFKENFSDHHAVLGIAINSNPKEARKRYLQIARRLHPDSLRAASEQERQMASELLSKLVNPAYEALSQEKAAAEHTLLLRMKGQQLSRTPAAPEITSDAAKTLLASKNLEHEYLTAVRSLTKSQYESLEDIANVIGQISELNLVYVMGQGGEQSSSADAQSQPTAPTQAAPTAARSAAKAAPPPPKRNREVIIESYLERARMFEREQDYNQAMLELREVLKTYPDSADCHGQLAAVYVKLGQNTMARVHAKRALDIQPDNELAQKVQKHLQRKQGAAEKAKASDQNSKSSSGFFGLFGGKKK